MTMPAPYPLVWPAAVARVGLREHPSRFARRSVVSAWSELHREGRLLADGGRSVISSNVPVRNDGKPYADAPTAGDDPGVALHVRRRGRWYAVTCDRYNASWANMHGLALIVESIRAIERHGSTGLLEQALGGFAALPPARELSPPWWVTLGFDALPSSEDGVEIARRRLLVELHPDRGGDPIRFALVTDAARQAREHFGGA